MYDIIKSKSLEELRRQVTLRMDYGWIPQGGISKTNENNYIKSYSHTGLVRFTPSEWIYLQAIIKLQPQLIIKGI